MTTEQAKIEILRLQRIIEDNEKLEIPTPLVNPDFSRLIQVAKNHIDDISKSGFADENSDHWFYELVMESIYGPNVWEWITKKSR